jgi:hypothetical protein
VGQIEKDGLPDTDRKRGRGRLRLKNEIDSRYEEEISSTSGPRRLALPSSQRSPIILVLVLGISRRFRNEFPGFVSV